MTIPPEAFVPFIEEALDGMLNIVASLGDERINRRPDLPETNSPFAILTHCVGMSEYWLGSVLCGRPSMRDRDSEFRARGTVDEIRQAVDTLKQQIRKDIAQAWAGDHPVDPVHSRYKTRQDVLLHCYTELAQHHGQMELTRDILLAG